MLNLPISNFSGIFGIIPSFLGYEPVLSGPRRDKTCFLGFANNKGADQPAHPQSLIKAYVVGLLESTIYRPATSKISIF